MVEVFQLAVRFFPRLQRSGLMAEQCDDGNNLVWSTGRFRSYEGNWLTEQVAKALLVSGW